MTAPAFDTMPSVKERSQPDSMMPMILTDQHGREFSTQLSKDSGHPTTMLTAVGWRPPLQSMVPPQKYFTFGKGARLGQTRIDYERWIVDYTNAHKEYEVELRTWAKRAFQMGAARAIAERDPELIALAGQPPQHVDFIKAMASGNKWALGLPRPDGGAYPMPPWAEPLLDSWRVIETYDGSDVDVTWDAADFPDVDDDAAEVAERIARAERFADVEEATDPDASPSWRPAPRTRAKRKED